MHSMHGGHITWEMLHHHGVNLSTSCQRREFPSMEFPSMEFPSMEFPSMV